MRRQFIRVYIGITTVLLLAAFAAMFVLDQMREAGVARWLEEASAPMVAEIREELAKVADRPDEIGQTVEILSTLYRQSIWIAPISELALSAGDGKRLHTGETVLVRGDRRRHRIYAAINDSEAVVLEPRIWRGRSPDGFPDRGADAFPGGGRGMFPGRPPFMPGASPGPPKPPFGRPVFGEFLPISLLLAILVLIGAAIYFLIRPIERRIHRLALATERFGKGDLSSRAEAGSGDAIAELAGTFNAMAGRIEGLIDRQRELLHAVSHELRTPMSRLLFLLDNARDADTSEAKNQHLWRIERTLAGMNDLVEELLIFVRLDGDTEQPVPERIDIPEAIQSLAEEVLPLRDGVALEIDCDSAQISTVSRYFRRAVLNLLTNAVRHARERIRVSCGREDGTICLYVDDDGPGVPEEAREKVFEPFFRLDESRTAGEGGVGLGLAIVQRIMVSLGGTARVTDSPLGGARFTLVFPGSGQAVDQT